MFLNIEWNSYFIDSGSKLVIAMVSAFKCVFLKDILVLECYYIVSLYA